jgi:hypothetical protein
VIELRIVMPDKSVWGVPAEFIADHRARHYGDKAGRWDQEEYERERAHALTDDAELIDWAARNMNWSDVMQVARLVRAAPSGVDYQEGWMNGAKHVVRKDPVLVVADA